MSAAHVLSRRFLFGSETHSAGSPGVFELLARLRVIRPKLHIFRHIHGGYGVTVSAEVPGTTFLNVAGCTESYRPKNAPHQ